MSIHEKLANVHMTLMGMKIPKTGYNGHKKFRYYELEDIMPHIIRECYNQGLTVEFTYCEDVAILKIVDWVNPKEYIPYRVRIPDMVTPDKNPNNAIIQTLGANISYLQRYLLKLAFPCLTDKDVIDNAVEENTAPAKAEPVKDNEVIELPMSELIVRARDVLVKKGVSENEIDTKALKRTILTMQQWKVAERRCILNYFKEQEAS